ncbi:MAG: hypothetical protein ACC660_00265 [Acidimicrobiales bacterium]
MGVIASRESLPLRRLLAGFVAMALVATACGASANVEVAEDQAAEATPEAAATPEPTETAEPEPAATATPAPTAETENPPSGTTIDVAAGFLTLTLPDGWELIEDPRSEIAPTVDAVEDVYSFDGDNLQTLVSFSNGNLSVFVANEPRFHTAPDYPTWRDAVLNAWDERGLSRNIQVPLGWAGGEGDSVIGRQPAGGFIQIDTVSVDGIHLTATSLSAGDAEDAELAQLRTILADIVVDAGALSPLAHSVDARSFASEEATGSTPFTASFLAPRDWSLQDEEGIRYTAPDEASFLQILLQLDTEGMESHIEIELAETGDEFLGPAQVRTGFNAGAVPVVVVWSGEPGVADAALVTASDGVIFMSTYILSPDPELLQEIVDSLVFPLSAFTG